MVKPRLKKLFSGEKCGICHRPAQGIKYNAISCDSCRVFFRRIVIMKDTCTKTNQPFEQPCMRNHILHKNPGLPERDIMLKCQHCRFMQCITAGMKEEYVQGSIAFVDHRTCRRKKGKSTSPRAESTSPSTSSTISDICQNKLRMNNYTLGAQKQQLVEMIRQFWLSYCNTSSSQASQLSERTNSACGGMVERKMPQTVNCVDHIKTALYMHVRKLTDFLNLLPMTGGMFSEEKKQMIVMKCYIEVIVLRWTTTTTESDKGRHIRGVTGINYNFDEMCKFGSSWTDKFKEYFSISRIINKAQPDETDLALMSALIILTADRHSDLSEQQKSIMSAYQEFFAEFLWEKCKAENNKKKFYILISELVHLRSTIREVDVTKVHGYQRRIVLTNDVTITV